MLEKLIGHILFDVGALAVPFGFGSWIVAWDLWRDRGERAFAALMVLAGIGLLALGIWLLRLTLA